MSLLTQDQPEQRTAGKASSAAVKPKVADRTATITQSLAQRMSDAYQEVKAQTCLQVIEQLEESGNAVDSLGSKGLRDVIESVITSRSRRGQLALNSAERLLLVEDIEDEVAGFGPLAPLLRDSTIDDIIVNGPQKVYVERMGRLSTIETRFRDDAHLMNIIQRIVSPIGRRVDESNPYVDARLPDNSRVNIVIPPVALDGPLLSIRKFKSQSFGIDSFVERSVLSQGMADYLESAVRSRLNILICGGTGAGKSTLLNLISSFIADDERLITIEDAAELQLRQDHVVRLETRPANQDGGREITARELVLNALRMRPDRIILGEVRGHEAVEMLQAMSTGHDGSMSTIHGNSPRDALSRLELLLGLAGLQQDMRIIRRFVASCIHVIAHVQRMANGRRRVVSISEITGVEGEAYLLNEIFAFEESTPMSGVGEFKTLATRPYHLARMRDYKTNTTSGAPINQSEVSAMGQTQW